MKIKGITNDEGNVVLCVDEVVSIVVLVGLTSVQVVVVVVFGGQTGGKMEGMIN